MPIQDEAHDALLAVLAEYDRARHAELFLDGDYDVTNLLDRLAAAARAVIS